MSNPVITITMENGDVMKGELDFSGSNGYLPADNRIGMYV